MIDLSAAMDDQLAHRGRVGRIPGSLQRGESPIRFAHGRAGVDADEVKSMAQEMPIASLSVPENRAGGHGMTKAVAWRVYPRSVQLR